MAYRNHKSAVETLTKLKLKRDAQDLYICGFTQRDIAEILNISHSSVKNYLKEVSEEYQHQAIQLRSEYTNRHLAELQVLRRAAWQAWQDSRQPTVTIQSGTEEGEDGTTIKALSKTVTTSGNPAFLQMVLNIQQREARLLGLDSPISLSLAELDTLTDEELELLKQGKALPPRLPLPLNDFTDKEPS